MAGSDAGHRGESEYLQVQTTTDSRAEAMELARAAVAARLAACSQVAGPVASTYWWNDELERAEEWFVFFKLPADRYDELAAFLAERHSYDEPEIAATPILSGSASFLAWIRDETRPRPPSGDPASGEPAADPEPGPQIPAGLGEGRHVPSRDDWFGVLGAQRAHGAGVQAEQPAVGGGQAQPPGGQHAQHVPVRD
jgi:periplasmic divalent cation tolerance protein